MSEIKTKIEGHAKFGIKLGLENITNVLNALGNPQEDVKIIHIAGTNGKGSVSSMISSCLQAAGHTVAKYCSPYLIEFNEMFIINDKQISDNELEQHYDRIIKVCNSLGIELTLYEITTTIMFLYASQFKVDYLVLEVGLGGRLDATNVVVPIVSAITNISLDHTNILGDTIEEIAFEKAGIIKPGIPVFTTESSREALKVFSDKTDKLVVVNLELDYNLNYQTFQTEINYRDEVYYLNLFGTHQVQNFALAICILEYIKVNVKALKQGMENVVHPARLERITNNIIFDGAHNPASAKALVDSMRGYQGEINIILSVLADKDVVQVIEILSQLSSNITFIQLPGLERGMSQEQFEKWKIRDITIANDVSEALNRNCLNLVCGTFSLYSQVVSLKQKQV